ncbi:MAG: hypothetical protein J1E82_04195 [Muribaculaceae bacterium]|nr:hypothetical protein [Muribaculaceae bacterium]
MDPLICIFTVIFILAIFILLYFYYNNREIELRKESEAQRGKIEAVRDRMFKVLQEQAKVSTEYRNAFEKIYPEIIAGRYFQGGEMMKWIQEANPNFDTSLYGQLMNSIDIQRGSFTTEQARMLDLINQRASLIESYPSKWFIRNKTPIDYVVISSALTKQVMASGIDDFMVSF